MNWKITKPNEPLYCDILNLYIKYNSKNINTTEYNIILNKLNNINIEKNTNDISVENINLDMNEHMKYYITGWYFFNMIQNEKHL